MVTLTFLLEALGYYSTKSIYLNLSFANFLLLATFYISVNTVGRPLYWTLEYRAFNCPIQDYSSSIRVIEMVLKLNFHFEF